MTNKRENRVERTNAIWSFLPDQVGGPGLDYIISRLNSEKTTLKWKTVKWIWGTVSLIWERVTLINLARFWWTSLTNRAHQPPVHDSSPVSSRPSWNGLRQTSVGRRRSAMLCSSTFYARQLTCTMVILVLFTRIVKKQATNHELLTDALSCSKWYSRDERDLRKSLVLKLSLQFLVSLFF